MTGKNNNQRTEVILWSIALPGFGQFLNGKYFKGAVLLILEFLINTKSNLNLAIISSFRGEIVAAIASTGFQWLMFYPCVYMYAIWDAYKDAGGNKCSFAFLPFVFAAYLGTIGVIYAASFRFMGYLLGPVWLPIILIIVGIGIGLLFTFFLSRKP
ncbi:MAG: hypothetical protein PHP51_04760 [Desulfotomaculaceae bacterium]|nr:hypothetical protein [Desulfotomaculaceae bacterium]MDD4766176.1 hypothetical protein [Desulfotomaculaceae bacterium]